MGGDSGWFKLHMIKYKRSLEGEKKRCEGILRAKNKGKFVKSKEQISKMVNTRKEKGSYKRTDGSFKKGHAPWNKNTLYGINTSLLLKIKQSNVYSNWRNNIYKKDNYRCICDSKKDINAHHIIPIKVIYEAFLKKYSSLTKDELYIKSKEYFKFWDETNGITLCLECHKDIHSHMNNLGSACT